ncbi:peptidylprolyl isomerase [uncultured Paraglaciecola sp.]|uniref:peptidylprolyl isomerase n=1 Tax=uncultured Paraglaciecola sp. TaxID=1765024 RepID=UPI002599744F|nr:peptidylprolyl isomerase [uncultured Paraglaciecola sp.]
MKINYAFLCCWILSFNVFAADQWRTPNAENLVYLKLETGTVIVELAPFIAPNHVTQFKNLVNEGFYDGLDFYRVIDGFVAQGGDLTEQKPSNNKSKLQAELHRTAPKNSDFMLIQSPDFMAPQTGFINEFPAARDPQTNQEWLVHCMGTLAFARDTDINSATTEFYIVIGQATRHLDKNMSSIGRVIYGMPAIQSLKRAHLNNASGVIEQPEDRSKIIWAKLATQVAKQDRIAIEIQRQDSAEFKKRLKKAKTLENEFFHYKGNGNLDVCYYKPKIRVKSN